MAKKEETKKAEEPKKVEEPKVEAAKKEETKKAEEPELKAKYSIAVTGFYAVNKMFRPKGGNEIDGKIYAKQIPVWLKKGYIR